MFRLDSANVYRAPELEALPWLEHGFGTRMSSGWPNAAELATVRQIHSNKVLQGDRGGCLGDGDALISNKPGITLAVRTADCLPILMADPRNRAIAAVHAGWRGTVQEIVLKTMEAMTEKFGTRQEDLVVAIGPGIGPCCFEVGPEVASQFGLTGRVKVDLAETILRQLRRNDGTLGHVATANMCSRCQPDLFESYRRDGEKAGRMVSAIAIR
ncbi:MAG TPA: peptidoglycan editing factor PgeF [Bryobacteraceae bacterium]|nr:peptidoglycan editing factor PgeF [Bryobacteraceae bacterium]